MYNFFRTVTGYKCLVLGYCTVPKITNIFCPTFDQVHVQLKKILLNLSPLHISSSNNTLVFASRYSWGYTHARTRYIDVLSWTKKVLRQKYEFQSYTLSVPFNAPMKCFKNSLLLSERHIDAQLYPKHLFILRNVIR
jgi:hypothetical protein